MNDPIIIFSADAPVEIHGGDGGSGPLFWKRLVGGVDLDGDWESFEYARLPPGGVIGEHIHDRTEEIYYVTQGRARMFLDDALTEVGPGDLILTPIGGKHRATNTGDEDWEFIVAEVLPPEILKPETKGSARKHMSARVRLQPNQSIEPSAHFNGPWQSIALQRVRTGERANLSGASMEHALYVVAGNGVASTRDRSIPLKRGGGLAVPRGGQVTVEATGPDLELLLVSVRL